MEFFYVQYMVLYNKNSRRLIHIFIKFSCFKPKLNETPMLIIYENISFVLCPKKILSVPNFIRLFLMILTSDQRVAFGIKLTLNR